MYMGEHIVRITCLRPTRAEQERVHTLDHSAHTDVRTPHRHVRTRLYFTSESHIHSLFNVLRWGSRHPEGSDGAPSMFSEQAHRLFQDIELGYLTHIVIRVLLRRRADASSPSAYCVQVLVSPGIEHHNTVCQVPMPMCICACTDAHVLMHVHRCAYSYTDAHALMHML